MCSFLSGWPVGFPVCVTGSKCGPKSVGVSVESFSIKLTTSSAVISTKFSDGVLQEGETREQGAHPCWWWKSLTELESVLEEEGVRVSLERKLRTAAGD